MRGLVHVFKFLETQATKDEKGSRSGGNYDGYTTLRRAPRHNSSGRKSTNPFLFALFFLFAGIGESNCRQIEVRRSTVAWSANVGREWE